MLVIVRTLRGRAFDRTVFFWRTWPVLIPIIWFEILSNHTQIHTFFVLRSGAAAIGVAVASALIAANVTREDSGVSGATDFHQAPGLVQSPPAA